MRAIEDENPRLKGILPKGYSRSSLASNGSDALEGLINLFADVNMEAENGDQDEDIFGRIYEYFIKQFAMEGGQKGGEFYTPKSVVELMVEILEPYEGRIFDPFSGSGGMFVQSQKFIESHGGDTDKISIYGQEVKESTLQISKMNLYLRGLDGNIKQGDSILNDQHKGLEADYILTNPPFNMSEWGKDSIADDDPRFEYGMPPSNNANYAFIQHMIHHLNDTGMAATVMANGAMSAQNNQGEIRKNIIEDDLLDTVIALPGELFYTTGIPACIFVFSKGKGDDQYRNRSGETLFIDAMDLYESVNNTQNRLGEEHIERIVNTIRSYRGEENIGEYKDEKGFCKVVNHDDIAEKEYIITPGRYVGVKEDDGDEEPFNQKMERLSSELRENFKKSNELQEKIDKSLQEVGF
jgi:type I restriction enzyme M protein